MMQIQPKTHEQRIAELEAQVAELLRIVGRPSPYAGLPNMQLGGLSGPANMQSQSLGDIAYAQAAEAQKLQAAADPDKKAKWFSGYDSRP